jgi:hypothetical protein
MAEPQRGHNALSSPSRTRSPEPQVVGEALANDARTATPPRGAVERRATSPLVADSKVESPPRDVEVVATVSVRDVNATTPPGVIDVDPINAQPTEDLVREQPQIYQGPAGPGTSGVQVPPTSSSSARLPRREINWNHTPWQEDWFEDIEDKRALQASIVTINNVLTVSYLVT